MDLHHPLQLLTQVKAWPQVVSLIDTAIKAGHEIKWDVKLEAGEVVVTARLKLDLPPVAEAVAEHLPPVDLPIPSLHDLYLGAGKATQTPAPDQQSE